MEFMINYKTLSRYYDALMWNDHIDIYINLIREFSEKSNDKQTLLDLWCGTWSLLKVVWWEYETYGIDLSDEIIEIAKEKINNEGIWLVVYLISIFLRNLISLPVVLIQ